MTTTKELFFKNYSPLLFSFFADRADLGKKLLLFFSFYIYYKVDREALVAIDVGSGLADSSSNS